ncbi:MAG: efflux RND transporter periplasmic adaptor subunit [Prevotellaceae bacterium]|jgi:RND family efflux transporter MFP subunit|nr:efflux RND transporter periplasmic adaptor subunit [Prevotellaceae bacterium]
MRKIARIVSLSFLGCIGMGVLLVGCNGGKATEQKTETSAVVEVKTERVRRQPVDQIQSYTGVITPYSKNMIASQSAMRIEKIYVEIGDYVKAGQLLVKMEETAYLQSKLQVENLKTDYGRTQALYESGGVSKQVLDQLKTQLDVAEESLANLKKNTMLLSPIAGIVTARNFDNGDMTGGQSILQVQQLKPVKITLNIQEEYFSAVKPKMDAAIHLDIYPDKEFRGRAHLIYPTVDAVSHTFSTEFTYDNNDLALRPGMFVRAELNFGTIDNVVVPDKAVIKQPGTDDRYVYVVNTDNTVTYVKVKLGQRLGNTYEILSGLNDGDVVVTAGISKLVSGVKVTILATE